MIDEMKNSFFDYKDVLFESKKYLLVYLIFITVTGISTISKKNILYPKLEIATFVLVAILGIICILYYFKHNSEEELYKVAFVSIVCFGLICALLVPICGVSDELEHLTRSEITSEGVILPHWTGYDIGVDSLYNHTENEKTSSVINEGAGYRTIGSMGFFESVYDEEVTIQATPHDTDKINYTPMIQNSAFEQNPFYGYLPQAIGILIAKFLDLNVIWILWLGRICNLIFYAGLVSIAIKKVPYLKIPLLSVACIPVAVCQAASVSIDSMIFGLGILAIAYFIYLCQLKENSIDIKEIAIFSAICLLLGLCKLPYLAFVFLLLFIPSDKLKNDKNMTLYIILCIAAVGAIGVMWSGFSTNTLAHSWRSKYNLINSTQQLSLLYNQPSFILEFFNKIFGEEVVTMVFGFFNFYGSDKASYTDHYTLITTLIQLFLIFTLILYPTDAKFSMKTKIGALLVLLIVYVGTDFIQLLTWARVGRTNLGTSLRYFIPLLGLIPIIIHTNRLKPDKRIDNYSIIIIIGFMAALILAFATKYY